MLPTNNIPNIRRLVGEGEEIIYVARQHPLYGWEYLLGAFSSLALAFVGAMVLHVPLLGWAFLAITVVMFGIYLMPFYYFEMAVTTHRFLAQQGRWNVEMEEILPIHLDHWDLKQNLLLGLIKTGHVTLHLRSGMQLRERCFRWLNDPLALLANLEKLSPNNATRLNAEGKPKLPATVENQKNSPQNSVEPAPPAGHAKPAENNNRPPPPEITGQHFAPGLEGPRGTGNKITAG